MYYLPYLSTTLSNYPTKESVINMLSALTVPSLTPVPFEVPLPPSRTWIPYPPYVGFSPYMSFESVYTCAEWEDEERGFDGDSSRRPDTFVGCSLPSLRCLKTNKRKGVSKSCYWNPLSKLVNPGAKHCFSMNGIRVNVPRLV